MDGEIEEIGEWMDEYMQMNGWIYNFSYIVSN